MAAATVTDPCLSAFSAQRWWGLFLRTQCCQAKVLKELVIVSDVIENLIINIFLGGYFSCVLVLLISPHFDWHVPWSIYVCGFTLTQETTLSSVIWDKTIPFILPVEIQFTKLSLSQTFTNTELTQPHFSPSLSLALYPLYLSLLSLWITWQGCWVTPRPKQHLGRALFAFFSKKYRKKVESKNRIPDTKKILFRFSSSMQGPDRYADLQEIRWWGMHD